MKDLTKGKPSSLILSFALPIFLGSVLQLTYSLADTRIVGSYLGDHALAAVGATSTLTGLLVGFLGGLCNGFAIITAQRFGAGDREGVKRTLAGALYLGGGITALLTVFVLCLLKPLLRFMNVPEELTDIAADYVVIIAAGLLVTLLYDIFSAVLRAMGDTVAPLFILAISVVLNIGGDLLFVLVLKAGVRGAAAATVLSQAAAAAACLIYMLCRYEFLRLKREDFRKAERAMLRKMLTSGLSMGFMSSLVNLGTLTLQTAINRLGQDIIVAHTAARKLTEVFMMMFTVFGQTMATWCGQNLGAGKTERIRRGISLALLYTCIWCGLVVLASYTVGARLVRLVTGTQNAEIIKNATDYLKFDTLFYVVTAVICVVRNALQGLGEHITPIVSSSLEMIGKIAIAKLLVPPLGYTGVIIAEPIVWAVMVIPLVFKLFRMPAFRHRREKAVG